MVCLFSIVSSFDTLSGVVDKTATSSKTKGSPRAIAGPNLSFGFFFFVRGASFFGLMHWCVPSDGMRFF